MHEFGFTGAIRGRFGNVSGRNEEHCGSIVHRMPTGTHSMNNRSTMFLISSGNIVDRLFIECQPGHIQYHAGKSIDTSERDACRSEYLRKQFENVDKPVNSILNPTTGEENADTESTNEEENDKG